MGKRRIFLTENMKGNSSDLWSKELTGGETVVQTENRKAQVSEFVMIHLMENVMACM